MKKPIDGMELGKVLCEMFGIDPSNVIGLEVKAYINELAEVEIITRPEWADGFTLSRTFKLMDDK
jgi:hypothetical protein